jgi:hypothetical protein
MAKRACRKGYVCRKAGRKARKGKSKARSASRKPHCVKVRGSSGRALKCFRSPGAAVRAAARLRAKGLNIIVRTGKISGLKKR